MPSKSGLAPASGYKAGEMEKTRTTHTRKHRHSLPVPFEKMEVSVQVVGLASKN